MSFKFIKNLGFSDGEKYAVKTTNLKKKFLVSSTNQYVSNVNTFLLKEVRELLRNGIITVTTIKRISETNVDEIVPAVIMGINGTFCSIIPKK